MGRFRPARRSFASAQELFEGLGTLWQLGRTFFEMGELEVQAGDLNAAQVSYKKALESFEQAGAKPYLEKTRSELAKIGTSSHKDVKHTRM